jgi:hypothetical protein
MAKHPTVTVFDTEEVVEVELEEIAKKNGNEIPNEKINEYIDKELEILKKEILEDGNYERFEHTIEDKDGDIWICIKTFNISRLQKMFGTEPE